MTLLLHCSTLHIVFDSFEYDTVQDNFFSPQLTKGIKNIMSSLNCSTGYISWITLSSITRSHCYQISICFPETHLIVLVVEMESQYCHVRLIRHVLIDDFDSCVDIVEALRHLIELAANIVG